MAFSIQIPFFVRVALEAAESRMRDVRKTQGREHIPTAPIGIKAPEPVGGIPHRKATVRVTYPLGVRFKIELQSRYNGGFGGNEEDWEIVRVTARFPRGFGTAHATWEGEDGCAVITLPKREEGPTEDLPPEFA